jgi:multiple sugar transport system substrate-binding protein
MMKKLICFNVLVLMLVLLAACSSGTGGNKQTIEVALWDENTKEAVNASIKAFNEKHPDVKVNVTYTPWADYWTKLKTSLGGGSGPDVFWMNGPNFYQYSTQGLIKNLEPFIEDDSNFSKDIYFPAVVDLYSLEGDLYAAPYFVDAVGLYYNKTLFDDAGLEAHTVQSQSGYYNLMHQAGGYIISDDKTKSGFNTPEAKEAFNFIQNLIDKGISPSTQTQIETKPEQMFMSGKVAMLPRISVSAAEFEGELGEELGVAPLPKGKQEASIVHGIGWAMNEKTKDQDLAWELIKSLANEDGNRVIAESGFSIPAIKGMSDVWKESLPSLDLQIFIDAQETGVAYPVSKRTAEWQDVETAEIQRAFLGQQTIDEALEKIGTKMDEILEAEQSD